MTLYSYDITRSMQAPPMERGLSQARLDQYLLQTDKHIQALSQQHQQQQMPLLTIVEQDDDIAPINRLARYLQEHFSDLVVIGTGGSATNPKSLIELLAPNQRKMQIHFISNVDPFTTDYYAESLPLKTTAFLVISKSGGTIETVSTACYFISLLKQQLGMDAVKKQFFLLSGKQSSILRSLADEYQFSTTEHADIGGRFSALSSVGLIAAAAAGLDAAGFKQGAREVVHQTFNKPVTQSYVAQAAATGYGLLQNKFPILVTMPYLDKLESLAVWHRQTWAESLGKKGVHTTAIKALGTVDQHSQLQLYLDAYKDKQFLSIRFDSTRLGKKITSIPIKDPSFECLPELHFGDLLMAEQIATMQTLYQNGSPVREIVLNAIDEPTIGAVMMHLMLEIILIADLLQINAFDQPAVEESKRLARQILKEKQPVA